MFSGTRVTSCDEGSIITGARCQASLLRLGLLLGMGTGGGEWGCKLPASWPRAFDSSPPAPEAAEAWMGLTVNQIRENQMCQGEYAVGIVAHARCTGIAILEFCKHMCWAAKILPVS